MGAGASDIRPIFGAADGRTALALPTLVGYVLSIRATMVMTITARPATIRKKTICGTVYASIVSLQSTPGPTSTTLAASLPGMSGPIGASVRNA